MASKNESYLQQLLPTDVESNIKNAKRPDDNMKETCGYTPAEGPVARSIIYDLLQIRGFPRKKLHPSETTDHLESYTNHERSARRVREDQSQPRSGKYPFPKPPSPRAIEDPC